MSGPANLPESNVSPHPLFVKYHKADPGKSQYEELLDGASRVVGDPAQKAGKSILTLSTPDGEGMEDSIIAMEREIGESTKEVCSAIMQCLRLLSLSQRGQETELGGQDETPDSQDLNGDWLSPVPRPELPGGPAVLDYAIDVDVEWSEAQLRLMDTINALANGHPVPVAAGAIAPHAARMDVFAGETHLGHFFSDDLFEANELVASGEWATTEGAELTGEWPEEDAEMSFSCGGMDFGVSADGPVEKSAARVVGASA